MTASSIRKLVDIRVVIEPPAYVSRQYKGLERQAKELEGWAAELEKFIRDHRSQDAISITVEREHQDTCSVCGDRWEPWEHDGGTYCACCGAIVKPEADHE